MGFPLAYTRWSFRPSTMPDVDQKTLCDVIKKQVINPVLPRDLSHEGLIYHINPTGKFVVGGPHGDSGVTGRKIIVDTYGGRARHGGGAFQRQGSDEGGSLGGYMARYVAKNIVAAGLADRCEIQLAYAIGVSEPVSVFVDTEGTGQIPDGDISRPDPQAFPAYAQRNHRASRTCADRSIAKRPLEAILAATSRNLPGKKPTRPSFLRRPPARWPLAREFARFLLIASLYPR